MNIKEKINEMSWQKVLVFAIAIMIGVSVVHEIIASILFQSSFNRIVQDVNDEEQAIHDARMKAKARDEIIDKQMNKNFSEIGKIQEHASRELHQTMKNIQNSQ